MGSHFSAIYTAEKKWSGPIFLTVYKGNMIEKRNSTHARNHRKARRAHMKVVRNEDAFTQCFRTAKGVQTIFFRAIAAYGPKTRKKRVRIHFMKTLYGMFTRQKYLVRTNFFMGPGPFFPVV